MARNLRHEKFARLYALTGEKAQSYLQAGYNCTYMAAAVSADTLLKNPKIQSLVEQHQARLASRMDVEQDEVLRELTAIGMSNIEDYLTYDNAGVRFKSSTELSREQLAAVKAIKFRRVTRLSEEGDSISTDNIELVFHDKHRALETLTSVLGMRKDTKPDNPGNNPLAVILLPIKLQAGAPVDFSGIELPAQFQEIQAKQIAQPANSNRHNGNGAH